MPRADNVPLDVGGLLVSSAARITRRRLLRCAATYAGRFFLTPEAIGCKMPFPAIDEGLSYAQDSGQIKAGMALPC